MTTISATRRLFAIVALALAGFAAPALALAPFESSLSLGAGHGTPDAATFMMLSIGLLMVVLANRRRTMDTIVSA